MAVAGIPATVNCGTSLNIMKINWGTGIAIVYVGFMAAMIFAVYQSTKQDHTLVVEDYYKEDLAYQSHYDKVANDRQHPQALVIQQDKAAGAIKLAFPAEEGAVTGTVTFYRPANKSQDFSLPIELNAENTFSIPVAEMPKGLWRMKVDWQAKGTSYFKEETVVL